MKRLLFALALTGGLAPWTMAQETRPQQRQENRETRQEARQEGRQEARQDAQQDRNQSRQEVRQDRREARQDRAQQRLGNRTQYYGNETWSQLDPWIQRNNLTPLERLGRAAGAATEATEKALNSANKIAAEVGANANAQTQARYGFANPNGPGKTAGSTTITLIRQPTITPRLPEPRCMDRPRAITISTTMVSMRA